MLTGIKLHHGFISVSKDNPTIIYHFVQSAVSKEFTHGRCVFLSLLLLQLIGQQIAAAIEYWIQSLPIYIAVTGSVKIFAKLKNVFFFVSILPSGSQHDFFFPELG